MIGEFNAGLLPIAEGTTLRSFLAKMLNCNPKRVSKKYDGNKIYNGKSAFSRAKTQPPSAAACERQEQLLELERKFREALSTMQRVESRLQSLTATGSYAFGGQPPAIESRPSSSAASSLTASGDEEGAAAAAPAVAGQQYSFQVRPAPSTKVGMDATSSVAQVSQCLDGSGNNSATSLGANDRKPAAAANSGADSCDEAAASQMLLQLRSPFHSAANATATQVSSTQWTAQDNNAPSRDASFNGDLILQDLHQSQARDEAAAASCPAVSAPKQQNNAGGDNATLQSILQNIQNMQQGQQQSAAPAPANLQDFLTLSGMFQQQQQQQQEQQPKIGSPIQGPRATQNNLQELLQFLQKNNGVSGTANGGSTTDILLRQLGLHNGGQQVQQQQQQQMPPPIDLQSVLMTLQQQQPQQPVGPQKSDLERLMESFVNSNKNGQQPQQQQQAPAPVSLAPNGTSTLASIFQQIAQQSAPTPAAPPPPAPTQNNDWGGILQALAQAQVNQSQQGQTNMNSFLTQDPSRQQNQQQQPTLENAMSCVMNQVQQFQQQQSTAQQQQQQQGQPQGINAPMLQNLMQSMGSQQQQQQQAPKPPNPTVQETLQKWVVSMQQQQQHQ